MHKFSQEETSLSMGRAVSHVAAARTRHSDHVLTLLVAGAPVKGGGKAGLGEREREDLSLPLKGAERKFLLKRSLQPPRCFSKTCGNISRLGYIQQSMVNAFLYALSTSPRGEHSRNSSFPWCRQIRSLSVCLKDGDRT